LEAGDFESELGGERLELLAVVRGLEALEQPSQVTLVTPSRYVQRGLRYGLPPWRENQWRWERFGELTPVKNADLWQRVDRALEFHRVDCRVWRLDSPATPSGAAESAGESDGEPAGEQPHGAPVPRPHFSHRARRATDPGSPKRLPAAHRDARPGSAGVRRWLSVARSALGQGPRRDAVMPGEVA
jgi:ribonuclease HI